MVSAAARRSILVGGGGDTPVPKNRRRGAGGQKNFLKDSQKNFVLRILEAICPELSS